MSRESKKKKFKGKEQGKPNTVLIGALVAGIAIIAGIFLFGGKDQAANSPYDGRVVQQSVVDFEVKEDKVYVEESELTSKEFVIFNVPLNEPIVAQTWTGAKEFNYLPITVFKRANDELVAAIGLCEPCTSESMRIEGNNLICNSCNTIWTLDTFKGVTGGCKDFPPVPITAEIVDGKIVLDKTEIDNFEPRPL